MPAVAFYIGKDAVRESALSVRVVWVAPQNVSGGCQFAQANRLFIGREHQNLIVTVSSYLRDKLVPVLSAREVEHRVWTAAMAVAAGYDRPVVFFSQS